MNDIHHLIHKYIFSATILVILNNTSSGGLRSTSLSSIPPSRNIEVKSRGSTYYFITETVNITRFNSFPTACWRVCFQVMQILFITMCNIISYCFWISLLSFMLYFMNFQIFYFLFFASIPSFSSSCSDMSKTTCSWQLTPSVTWCSWVHWPTWSQLIQTGFLFSASGFIFNQWLYWFWLYAHNLPFFHSALPFI